MSAAPLIADTPLGPLPPHSIEAERAVLGGLLLDNAAWPRVRDILEERHFYRLDHRLIWRAIAQLLKAGSAADVLTTAEALKASDELDQVGGVGGLHQIASETPSAANISRYAAIVAEHARRRLVAEVGLTLQNEALRPGADVVVLRRHAEERLQSLAPATLGPDPLDLEALAEQEPLRPQYLLPDVMPLGCGTGFWADGGTGKSLLALLQAVCLAAGVPFLGLEPARRCRVGYLDCEDPAAVMHWRLVRACRYLGVDLASLRGWLEVYDLTGQDAVLWTPDRGRGCTTPTYGWLAERMKGVDVLIVDGTADTFAGNENDRSEVKRYVNACLSLIDRERGALMLLGHVDKPGAKSPKSSLGFSGSTQWHNAVRARWFMYPETTGDGDDAETTGAMILEFRKNQYGRKDVPAIRLTWNEDAGLFTPTNIGTGFVHLDRLTQEREEQDGIMAALRARAAVDYVPAATSGRRTAYHVLEAAPEFPASLRAGKPALRRFWRHVETLRHRGEIRTEERRAADRHYVTVLLPAGNDAP